METRVQSFGWEDPLEKEMATHSSTLAWRIPWTEEPSGLQSMQLQRIPDRILMLLGTDCTRNLMKGFPCGSVDKESACNVGDLGSIPGLGRSPGEGKG